MKRNNNENDNAYLERLTQNLDPVLFKTFVMKDCLNFLNKIKNNQYNNTVISLIEKWLKDPNFSPHFSENSNAITYISTAYWSAYWSLKATCPRNVASYAANAYSYSSSCNIYKRNDKFKSYIRFAKSLILKPTLPRSFISYLLNSQTEEELNVFLIDYAQDHDLYPKVQDYLEYLYEQPYNSSMILNNPETKTLLY